MNGLQIVGFDFWYFYTNDKWQYPLVNEQFAIWKSHEKAMVSAYSFDGQFQRFFLRPSPVQRWYLEHPQMVGL